MIEIRTAVDTNGTWFCAKDVFASLNLAWNGHSSIKSLVNTDATVAKVVTPVGGHTCKLNQIVLSESGVKKVCKLHNIKLSTVSHLFNSVVAKDTSTNEEIKKLQKTIDELKVVVAQLLTKDAKTKISLPLTGKTGKVETAISQAEARKMVRKTVEDYAKVKADALNIVDPQKRSMFYDLTYKALYTEYMKRTSKHVDLKKLAEIKSKDTNSRVSALQVAEQLGVANELLTLATTLYNK